MQTRGTGRQNPARLPTDCSSQSRTRRHSAISSDGDGRPSNGVHLSPLRDRRRRNAQGERDQARRFPHAGEQTGNEEPPVPCAIGRTLGSLKHLTIRGIQIASGQQIQVKVPRSNVYHALVHSADGADLSINSLCASTCGKRSAVTRARFKVTVPAQHLRNSRPRATLSVK